MFTGIIKNLGKVTGISKSTLSIHIPPILVNKLKKGSSLSVNGVCLTVSSKKETFVTVDIMPETWRKTALGNLAIDNPVNLELPMKIGNTFDGHIVQGHVDGVGTIQKLVKDVNSRVYTIKTEPDLTKFMIEKGSVALNGVSLTLIQVNNTSFTVGIIPYTYSHTMLHTSHTGDRVNIELDILAKYFAKFIKNYKYNT